MAMPNQNMQGAPGQAMPEQILPNQMAPQNPNAASLGSAAMAANQAQPVSPNKESPTSTQSTLLISELRDNVVIMKDGSFRAVIACKSINFDLMSGTEQDSVEQFYQELLNSLNFNIQILVRSQRVDIGPYIEKLTEIRRSNDNMLLGVLMDDYLDFIDALAQGANIMDKTFFKSFAKNKAPEVVRIDRATYNKALDELTNRVSLVMDGLYRIGSRAVRLNTRQLAELYYNFNNPDTAVREPLVDFSQLATMYVKKGENNG